VAILSGCFEPDEVLPKTRINEVSVRLNIVDNQVAYLDLNELYNTNIGVSSTWQLKFQNAKKSWSVYINPLRTSGVHNTKETDYYAIDQHYNVNSIVWNVDVPTQSGAYPAIGAWGDFSFSNPKSYKNVYILSWEDFGKTVYYKFQLLDATDSAYQIRFGTLDGLLDYTRWIKKDLNYTHTYLDIKSQLLYTKLEPSKDKWSLCFTYVSDSIRLHTKLPYIPSASIDFGLFHAVIVNRDLNQIATDTSVVFEDIDYFYARSLNYIKKDQLLSPFYTWDFVKQQAVVKDKTTLLIRNGERYFALQPISVKNEGVQSVLITMRIRQL
jgi:hypothetical protein